MTSGVRTPATPSSPSSLEAPRPQRKGRGALARACAALALAARRKGKSYHQPPKVSPRLPPTRGRALVSPTTPRRPDVPDTCRTHLPRSAHPRVSQDKSDRSHRRLRPTPPEVPKVTRRGGGAYPYVIFFGDTYWAEGGVAPPPRAVQVKFGSRLSRRTGRRGVSHLPPEQCK